MLLPPRPHVAASRRATYTKFLTDPWLGTAQRDASAASGLVLMGVRVYNPVTGRFLTTDPVLGGVAGPYSYPADPVNNADVLGQATIRLIAWGYIRAERTGKWGQSWRWIAHITFTCRGCVWGATYYVGLMVWPNDHAYWSQYGSSRGCGCGRTTFDVWLATTSWNADYLYDYWYRLEWSISYLYTGGWGPFIYPVYRTWSETKSGEAFRYGYGIV